MAPTRVSDSPKSTSARGRKTSATAKKSTTSSSITCAPDEATRVLIDRAANVLGQNRTEFVLTSARLRAQEVLLNEVYFELDDGDWKALKDILDSPPSPNEDLKRLTSRKPTWER